MKKKLALSVAFAIFCGGAVAGPAEKIGAWFDNQNYANVTNPGVFKGQSGRMFTGGSVSTRAPITQPFEFANIQTPRFSAGCGGIDIHMGGFTLIDSDQFVEKMRAIGQNAQGLVFMLAIQAVSPLLSGAMEFMEEVQGQLNKMNMDSCQAATQLVGGALEYFDSVKANCIAKRRKERGEDFATASTYCSTRGGSTEGTTNEIAFVEGNITWYVLMNDPFFKADPTWAELMMNIIGTITITRADNTADTPRIRNVLTPAINDSGTTERFKNLVNAILHGTQAQSITIWRCEDGRQPDPMGCKSLKANPETVAVTWKGIYERVNEMLTSIYSKIRSDEKLTDAEYGLIASTSLPIYRFLSAASTQFPAEYTIEQIGGTNYAMLISEDIIFKAIAAVLEKIEVGFRSPPKGMGESKEFKEYSDSIDRVRRGVASLIEARENKHLEIVTMLDNIAKYEKAILPKVGGEVASSALWGGK